MLTVKEIELASKNLEGVALHTPLQFNEALSEEFECNVYLKREDLQFVRSYKIRGAYNKISSLTVEEKENEMKDTSYQEV
jgi:threonine dehydratase